MTDDTTDPHDRRVADGLSPMRARNVGDARPDAEGFADIVWALTAVAPEDRPTIAETQSVLEQLR